MGLDGANHSGL